MLKTKVKRLVRSLENVYKKTVIITKCTYMKLTVIISY